MQLSFFGLIPDSGSSSKAALGRASRSRAGQQNLELRSTILESMEKV